MDSKSAVRTGIIDTHIHAWDTTQVRYSWLNAQPDLPRRTRLPSAAATHDAGVTGMLLVEAGADASERGAEQTWMLRLARSDSFIHGVIFPDQPESGTGIAGRRVPELLGFRVNVRSISAATLIEPALRRAAASDLSVDVLCSPHSLAAVADAARRSPGRSIVIDHMGDPPFRSGWHSNAMRRWRNDMRNLARIRRVVVKVSGHRGTDALRDSLRWVIDEFGTARCMLGSDWPISENAVYGTWFEAVADAIGGLDAEISHGTACRTYWHHSAPSSLK